MGGIIKDKIGQLLVGHLTVINDNKTIGGVLATGSADVAFGEPVAYTTDGYYHSASADTTEEEIAGIVQATNIKMAHEWPANGSGSIVKAGEAFNLLLKGWIAVKVSELEYDDIKAGHLVKYERGSKVFALTTGIPITGWVYTGIKEGSGTVTDPYRAEIRKI